jgi:hypothetical protein
MPSGTEITALIDRYDAAWNAQDLDAVASMHDDAIVFHNYTAAERVEGAEPVRARAGDGFAVSEWTARAEHRDDGRRLEWDGVDVFVVTPDRKLARKDVYSSSGTPRVRAG